VFQQYYRSFILSFNVDLVVSESILLSPTDAGNGLPLLFFFTSDGWLTDVGETQLTSYTSTDIFTLVFLDGESAKLYKNGIFVYNLGALGGQPYSFCFRLGSIGDSITNISYGSALRGPTGDTGTQGPTGTLLSFIGQWIESAYNANIVVVSPIDNNTYISKRVVEDVFTDPANNSSDWALYSTRGNTGQPGVTGPTGALGPTGAQGPTGTLGPALFSFKNGTNGSSTDYVANPANSIRCLVNTTTDVVFQQYYRSFILSFNVTLVVSESILLSSIDAANGLGLLFLITNDGWITDAGETQLTSYTSTDVFTLVFLDGESAKLYKNGIFFHSLGALGGQPYSFCFRLGSIGDSITNISYGSALVGPTGQTGTQGPAGTPLSFIGQWIESAYNANIVVVSPIDNNTYISKRVVEDVYTDPANNSSDWALYSTRGTIGPTGQLGPTGMVTNYVAGNEPYATGTSGAEGQFLLTTTVGTTATAIYELGPIVTASTTKLMLMANVCLINQAYTLVMTVGRATSSAASIANSSNIVADAEMWTNPPTSPCYYMAAYAGTAEGDEQPINLTGFCVDTPGAGTFYYTVWMTSSTSATYADMTLALTAMTIKS
jgi:hypothetical protein